MKKIEQIKMWWKGFKKETPKFYSRVRNVSITVASTIAVINTTVGAAKVPDWYTDSQWYILAACAIVGVWAQSHQKLSEVK